MNEYLVALWSALDGRLIVLSLLILVDIVFGIVISLVKKEFKWEYLTHYLNSDVLPVFGWVGIILLASIPGQFVPQGAALIGTDVVYGTVFLKILASILGSLAEMGILTESLRKIGVG